MPSRQHLHHLGIQIKQAGMRIITRQQTQQQFIDVIARQQCLAHRHDVTAYPLCHFESANLSVAAVTDSKRLQWQQDWTKVRTGSLSAFGDQGYATVMAGKCFKDETGLAPVVTVYDESRFGVDTGLTRSQSYAPVLRHPPNPSAL